MKKRLLPWLVMAPAAIALIAAAGSSARTDPASSAAKAQAVRVAIVTDIGGLNDKGFNSLSYAGLQRAQRQLGIEGRAIITRDANDRTPNLSAAARQGYGLVIGVGFLMFEPLNRVAPSFEDTKFAGVDVPYAVLEAKPTNVRGLIFNEQEAGYLVGFIAGLVVKAQSGSDVISAVGANQVPAIVRFIAGYRAGARKANPRTRVLVNYANDPTFADQAKCKEQALNQIARGSKIVFQVAGQCGLGALSAARERRVWGIGVDADQSFLGPHMLTSATKKVDVAVFQTIQDYRRNPDGFRGGSDRIFSVKNAGVGYGKVSARVPNRRAIIRQVEAIRRQIASGRIKPPTK